MIMKDAVANYILALGKFSVKRGADLEAKRGLVEAIQNLTDDKRLYAIFVNTVDNIRIPDVTVLHLYNHRFAEFVLDPDGDDVCPFGYTIEIHERCFDKYTDEELAALIMHDVLQNTHSDTARVRLLKAYTKIASKHTDAEIIRVFDRIDLDEVMYIAFIQICARPFKVPVMANQDYVATDEVLKMMGLGDAYDSYLKKTLPIMNMTPEESIDQAIQDDYRDFHTVFEACRSNDIRKYYTAIREGVPLLSLKTVFSGNSTIGALGFTGKKKELGTDRHPHHALTESFNDPKTEYEIQFQIDKIINEMRYAESEAERNVVLFKIKQTALKLVKQQKRLEHKTDANSTARKAFLTEKLAELDELRKKTMEMEIKTKRWSVYVKDDMPDGYDF